MPNFNPKNPTKFLGTNKYIIFSVTRNRQPTLADYLQPETGTYYSIGTVWQVGSNPTTGNYGEMWMLTKIVANQGYWVEITATVAITDSFGMQTGTNPVVPDGSGLVVFNGAVVPAGTNPVRTDGTGANTMALEVQISQAIASTNATNIGLAAFNSGHFSVDANGFVSLLGGGQAIDSVAVDANTAPGTNPVVPTALGLITVTGGQVAAGTTTNVIRTISLAANTYTVQIQRSSAQATTTIGANGVSHFNSNQFSVDANGFVSLSVTGFTSIVLRVFTGPGTYTPTSGMKYCIIECVGGGGGGGGSSTCSATQVSVGGGGASGVYARKLSTAATVGASQVVTIGSGGSAGATGGGSGGTGGTTSVGSICSANGGAGGVGTAATSSFVIAAGGNSTSTGTGDVVVPSRTGNIGIGSVSGAIVAGGSGGDSFYSGSAQAVVGTGAGPGNTGIVYGGGGGGACTAPSNSQQTGGAGAGGIVIITEYI
jgi:hypothetical protein